ncbi:hypothetical protein OQA88_3165 [Cercophora sp. LCS_1]
MPVADVVTAATDNPKQGKVGRIQTAVSSCRSLFRSFTGRLKRLWSFLKLWGLEFGGMVLGLALLAYIVGLLTSFNGREASEWTHPINLSTLASILVTIIRLCLLYALSVIISQLKWMWFTRDSRPLIDLSAIDEASRGPLGCLFLVPNLIRRIHKPGCRLLGSVATVAALVVIVSFGLDPFTQQAISNKACDRVSTDLISAIPVASYVYGDYYRTGAGLFEVSTSMKAAMIRALTDPESRDFEVRSVCPTRNCEFPDYGTGITHASIGVCSKCTDRKRDVRGPDKEHERNITLITDPRLGNRSDTIWIGTEAESFLSTTYTKAPDSQLRNSFGPVHVLAVSHAHCTVNSTGDGLICPNYNVANYIREVGDFAAVSCELYPCLRAYNGAVRDGVFEEKLVSTTVAISDNNQYVATFGPNYTALLQPCVPNPDGIWYTEANISSVPRSPDQSWAPVLLPSGANVTAPNTCLYKLRPYYAEAMKAYFEELFRSKACTYNGRQGAAVLCRDAWWLAPLYRNKSATVETLSEAMDNLTVAITNQLRLTGFGPDETPSTDPYTAWRGAGHTVKGSVVRETTCISFDWRWLIFPCALVVITMGLLVWTMVTNHKRGVPLWKRSELPLVLYGFKTKEDPEVVGLRIGEMEKRSEKMIAKCETGKDGGPIGLTRVDDLRDCLDGNDPDSGEALPMNSLLARAEEGRRD